MSLTWPASVGIETEPAKVTFLAFAASPTVAQSQLLLKQLGTSLYDTSWAVAPDGSGGAYFAGETQGSLGGPSAGNKDAWIARCNGAGNQLWIRQFGSQG